MAEANLRVLLGAMVLAVACGDSSGGEWTGTTEILEDGTRVIRNPATGIWPAGGESNWVLEEELRIGRQDGEGADVFGAIGGIQVDAAGRIYVIESQAREVRVFDPDGTVLRVLGGAGDGPGEFRSPSGVFQDEAGTTWVVDPASARYTRFDSAGLLLETRPRQSRAMGGGPFFGGLTPEGIVYDTDLHVPEESKDLPPLMLASGMGGSRLIVRAMFAIDGRSVSDTVDLPATTLEPVTFRTAGMLVSSPFNPRLHMVFDPRGAIWWGESDEYRIEHRFIEGGTVTRIHREHTAVAVSATEVDEWLASEGIRRFRERGGQPDASALQKEKPVFDGLFLDDRGYLWVRVVTGGEAPVYDVFDADGRYLGAVTGVAGMSGLAPIIVGDRFYAVIRGEYDVPYVARYRIRGRS